MEYVYTTQIFINVDSSNGDNLNKNLMNEVKIKTRKLNKEIKQIQLLGKK